MKIISITSKQIYDFYPTKGGENRTACPDCSRDRRKSKNKCFSFNAEKNTGYCNHCGAKFVEYKPNQKDKTYVIPEWKNKTKLSDRAVEWFESRMISQKTLDKMMVSSATEYMPQINKETTVVCFPYYRDGALVNVKYRDINKLFKFIKDAELIFYNIDCLKDETECVIVEGEIDCLSFVESGIKNVISVPNGASVTSMEFIDSAFEYMDKIKKFYIAVDNDLPGMKLKDELVRRLGAERCAIVNFKDCKDANEYLITHNSFELADILKEAQDVPVSDIVFVSNIYDRIYSLYQNGLQPGVTIGFWEIDKLITWEPGRVCVITGIPSHGKSEWLDFVLCRLNILHHWKIAYFSPENFPIELHYSKVASKISGKSFDVKYFNQDEFDNVFNYVEQNYFFIYPEENITIDNILDKAKYLVRKHGIKVLVIDPYNKIEQQRDRGETETDYISRILDKLSMFAKIHDCLIFLVAHPRKMERDKVTKKFLKPTLYDINGSANFYNKCDYGIVVYRNFDTSIIELLVSKVKFKHLGETGDVEMVYNYINGRFEKNGTPLDSFDNKSYLNHKPETIVPDPEIFEKTDIIPF